MEVLKLICGAFETNTYILKIDKSVIIIDPTGKKDKILKAVEGLNVLAIILTHGHFDHLGCVDELINVLDCPVYLNENDHELAHNEKLNSMAQYKASIYHDEIPLNEGTLKINDFIFDVYNTPGHTMGSCILLIDDCMFSGDLLFKESIGRTDLYSGNDAMMRQSIKFIKSFDPKIKVYPGHGPTTNLDYEFNHNYYLR